MKFEVTSKQKAQVNTWLKEEIYPPIIAEQRTSNNDWTIVAEMCWDAGYPYEGAIGGGLAWKFIPTSVGVITIALYGPHELNVTNWDDFG